MIPPKRENHDGDRAFLESHALSILPLSPFLDIPMCAFKCAGLPSVFQEQLRFRQAPSKEGKVTSREMKGEV